jgi:hypothetical protein
MKYLISYVNYIIILLLLLLLLFTDSIKLSYKPSDPIHNESCIHLMAVPFLEFQANIGRENFLQLVEANHSHES